VATDFCATNPDAFCTTATALVNGKASPASFSTLVEGQSFVLNAGASTLDACTGGSIHYQFVECDNLAGACDAPANGTILKDFSSASTQEVSPVTPTRYAVSVRCSSVGTCSGGTEDGNLCDMGNPDPCQSPGGGMCMAGGCEDTAFATVLPVDPGACGLVSIGLTCLDGGDGVCDVADTLNVSFTKPGPAGVSIDLDRGVDGELATPITSLSTNLANGAAAGGAPGSAQTLADATGANPPAGGLYYLVSCDNPGPKPAGKQRIDGEHVARFQNP
jgi:hypothetical protein